MKTVTIIQSSVTDDGKKAPVFPRNRIGHFSGNSHIITGDGLLIVQNGVDAAILIPWKELDKLAQQHEPLLAPCVLPKTTLRHAPVKT